MRSLRQWILGNKIAAFVIAMHVLLITGFQLGMDRTKSAAQMGDTVTASLLDANPQKEKSTIQRPTPTKPVEKKKTEEKEIPPVDPDKKSGTETAKGEANASREKSGELAQEEQKGDDTDYNQIFTSVQVQASPPGGMNAFRKQIASSFRLPEVDETTTGTVIAKFVVWDDGSIRDIQIVKESPAGLGLAKEATRILTKSPKWTPGVYNGRSVKQYYTLPISIQITASE